MAHIVQANFLQLFVGLVHNFMGYGAHVKMGKCAFGCKAECSVTVKVAFTIYR